MLSPFDIVDAPTARKIQEAMARYAELLEPWAVATATRMLNDVAARDRTAWLEHAQEMSHGMREMIRNTPVGTTLRELLADQVGLIKSIPVEAAQRVHRLTLEGLADSTRASEIAKEIARSGEVAASRATLIARTEVARTASKLTEARARHIGSRGYLWRSAGDGDVRPSHKEMAGRMFEWSNPPTLSDGMTGHPGTFPNCRCWAEPVLPDEFDP